MRLRRRDSEAAHSGHDYCPAIHRLPLTVRRLGGSARAVMSLGITGQAMDSSTARRLYAEHAHALAYVDVEKPTGERNIGTAFHIGEGVFVTARHVVDGNRIVEVRITEPVLLTSREYFREVLKKEVSDEEITKHAALGDRGLHRHWLDPLEIVEGPCFADNPELDVAAFRVRDIHRAAGVVKLGIH